MNKNTVILLLSAATLALSACAPTTTMETSVRTAPAGAMVTINGQAIQTPTPFQHIFKFDANQEYELRVNKEGYFEEEYFVNKTLPSLKNGEVLVKLTKSPLWEATTPSPATNNWIQVLVGDEIDARMAWQIMIDAVIKRSSNIKELNYESGYLQTKYTVRKFDTKRGEFLLRCQLIANLVSTEPLIYRIKDVAEWSGNGVQWHPYNRIFKEHQDMITEIQDRLRSY